MNTTHNHNQGGHVYATATIPVQRTQPVGTSHAPDVHHAPRVYRWRVVVPLLLALILLSGCGKHERAQAGSDAMAGLKALRMKLVAMEAGFATAEALAVLAGVEKYIPAATGVNPSEWPEPRMSPVLIEAHPELYDDNAPPVPPPSVDYLGVVLQVMLAVLGIAGGGYGVIGARIARKTKTALQIACDLADQNASAETDQDVERNKMIAMQQQVSAGVLAITQKARGK